VDFCYEKCVRAKYCTNSSGMWKVFDNETGYFKILVLLWSTCGSAAGEKYEREARENGSDSDSTSGPGLDIASFFGPIYDWATSGDGNHTVDYTNYTSYQDLQDTLTNVTYLIADIVKKELDQDSTTLEPQQPHKKQTFLPKYNVETVGNYTEKVAKNVKSMATVIDDVCAVTTYRPHCQCVQHEWDRVDTLSIHDLNFTKISSCLPETVDYKSLSKYTSISTLVVDDFFKATEDLLQTGNLKDLVRVLNVGMRQTNDIDPNLSINTYSAFLTAVEDAHHGKLTKFSRLLQSKMFKDSQIRVQERILKRLKAELLAASMKKVGQTLATKLMEMTEKGTPFDMLLSSFSPQNADDKLDLNFAEVILDNCLGAFTKGVATDLTAVHYITSAINSMLPPMAQNPDLASDDNSTASVGSSAFGMFGGIFGDFSDRLTLEDLTQRIEEVTMWISDSSDGRGKCIRKSINKLKRHHRKLKKAAYRKSIADREGIEFIPRPGMLSSEEFNDLIDKYTIASFKNGTILEVTITSTITNLGVLVPTPVTVSTTKASSIHVNMANNDGMVILIMAFFAALMLVGIYFYY